MFENKCKYNFTPFEELTREQVRDLRDKFLYKIKYYAGIMGVNYKKVTVKNQKTRCGSCSSKGNLNFNYKLYFLPDRLMDYVIVHELAHLRHMNHSEAFWKEVEKYYPNYKECRKELKEL